MIKKNNNTPLLAIIFSCIVSAYSDANVIRNSADVGSDQQPVIDIEALGAKTNWRTGSYSNFNKTARPVVRQIMPFGSQLFEGGFRGTRSDGLNNQYKITPGDQVTLRLWGAVNEQNILAVDSQGNVFVPSVGPIAVQGLTSSRLDTKIRSAVQSIYPQGVDVYTHLQGVQPVALFVTGFVIKPGRYAGTPSDSILYFLDQANGIDPELGSYRTISIIRAGDVMQVIDLYDFLLTGVMPKVQFEDGDTILVAERLRSVSVFGDVKKTYSYEFKTSDLSGADIIHLARLKTGVSNVLLQGDRKAGPYSAYFTVANFKAQPLQSGDIVYLSIDRRQEHIIVQIQGSYYGPSRYVVACDTRLNDFLAAIAVPANITATESIFISRRSVAKRQQVALTQSLRRLESAYLSPAANGTSKDAAVQAQKATLISRFVEKAKQVKPSGRLVVALDGKISNIRLQNGDLITIPEKSDSLLISGEIVVPQSVVFRLGRSVEDYIEGAGGFTQYANEDNILVVRQNGEVVSAEGIRLKAGDEILVMPEVPTNYLQLGTSIAQILYQIAVATAVVLDINDN